MGKYFDHNWQFIIQPNKCPQSYINKIPQNRPQLKLLSLTQKLKYILYLLVDESKSAQKYQIWTNVLYFCPKFCTNVCTHRMQPFQSLGSSDEKVLL